MKDFFDRNGHLTETAFAALKKNQLSEEDRLAAAEHLAFCDTCLLQYTLRLQETPPPTGFVLKTMRRTKRAVFADGLRRFGKVTAAACLTMVLWLGGWLAPSFSDETEGRQESIFRAVDEKLELMKGEFLDGEE